MFEEDFQKNKKHLQRITSAMYRVTDLMPNTEPLKNKLRDASCDLMTYCVSGDSYQKDKTKEISCRIDSLLSLMSLAVDCLPAIKKENFMVLKREYTSFLNTLENIIKNALEFKQDFTTASKKDIRVDREEDYKVFSAQSLSEIKSKQDTQLINAIESVNNEKTNAAVFLQRPFTERQKQILNYFTLNTKLQLKHILKDFQQISEKTVRNDLKVLCQSNIIKRTGQGKASFYIKA